MEINKQSLEIPYSSEKIYSYISNINNYESILTSEIKLIFTNDLPIK